MPLAKAVAGQLQQLHSQPKVPGQGRKKRFPRLAVEPVGQAFSLSRPAKRLLVSRDNRRHRLCQAIAIDRLVYDPRSGYAVADAIHGRVISVARDEHNRCIAHLSKPPSDLDAFATSFETDIHHDNIRLIAQGKPVGLFSVRRQVANIEAERAQGSFQADGEGDFIVNNQGHAVVRG